MRPFKNSWKAPCKPFRPKATVATIIIIIEGPLEQEILFTIGRYLLCLIDMVLHNIGTGIYRKNTIYPPLYTTI